MPLPLRNRSFDENDPVRVSICCITFNHRPFIEQCIQGFLDQECDFRVEIMIHDDASTDGTNEVIKQYADRHPSIFRVVQQAQNQYSKGVNPYYSYLFPEARGQFIAICDGDDYWDDPVKLANQVAYLDANSETVIVYGPVRAIGADGQDMDYRVGASQDLSAAELKAARPLNTLTTCFRNVFQHKPAPVYLRNSPIGDLTVWGYLGHYGTGKYLSDLKPANYRLHEGGVLSLVSKEKKFFMTALAQLNIAAFHAERNDREATVQSLKNAVKMINKIGYLPVIAVEVHAVSLLGLLRIWFKSVRRNRSG